MQKPRLNRFLLLCLTALILLTGGCANMVAVPYAPQQPSAKLPPVDPADNAFVRQQIYQQYQQWKGTGYAYGGLGKNGLDCSGLVYITYRDKLDQTVPRTTGKLAQSGVAVPRQQLRAGDLVFFTTGIKSRHVGIYIEDGKFLHVSTSKGVMISHLNDYYWKDRFLLARRVRD